MMLYVVYKKTKRYEQEKQRSKARQMANAERAKEDLKKAQEIKEKAKEKENESTTVQDEYGKLPELSAMATEIDRLPFPDSDLSGNEMDDHNNGDNKGVRPSVTQFVAVVHGNGHGLMQSLDHVPSRSDDSEAGGMSRTITIVTIINNNNSHAMSNCTQEDLKHVESELEKDKETQKNGKMNKMAMMKNIVVFRINTRYNNEIRNNNAVIANRDRTESVTVVINNDGPESPFASAASATPAAPSEGASATASASTNNNNNDEGRGGVGFGPNVVDNEDTDENEEDEDQQKKQKKKRKEKQKTKTKFRKKRTSLLFGKKKNKYNSIISTTRRKGAKRKRNS